MNDQAYGWEVELAPDAPSGAIHGVAVLFSPARVVDRANDEEWIVPVGERWTFAYGRLPRTFKRGWKVREIGPVGSSKVGWM